MSTLITGKPYRAKTSDYKATGAIFTAAVKTLHRWRERAQQRRDLSNLTPRELDDIGISAKAAAKEAAKPFWRA